MGDQDIKNRIVRKMLRKGLIGANKAQVQTVVGWAVASHEEGRAKDLIDEVVQEGVIERYGGGHRDNIRLAGEQAAVEYLKANDGDVPFGYGD